MPPTDLDALVARTEGLQPWRRVFHAANGIAIVVVLILLAPPRSVVLVVLSAITTALFVLDWVRFRLPAVNRIFFGLLHPFASPREARGVASSSWYMLGCLLTLALFPRATAIAAILVLAIADPLASYIGRRWGRRPFGSGTIEGSLVFATAAFGVLVFFADLPVAAGVALTTALAERIPWPFDDNLVIPLVVAALLTLVG
jgi:dolichol kinase